MDYYTSYKNSKDPSLLRKELINYAIDYGNKKAAQQFQTTVKTVRKWRTRWEEKKGEGIKDLSKKPKKSPRMMKMYWQFKIKAIAEKAAADNKRINGAMIKRQYNIPYSVTLFFIYDKIACFLIRRIPSLFISQNSEESRKSIFA